ncbi:AMP-binding protein [Ramlibacter sp. AW1]|uniref:AMP-binding protein n=1 Tax=Ramlibacter aurantiacus TaxID=2801330 RepID=A0A937D5H9_9BURK|nr:AMP-binding protein [Ramlibacter aurantiacus]MBL0418746.1 AMP-binding protein [Ramlibacter aurantiacus]
MSGLDEAHGPVLLGAGGLSLGRQALDAQVGAFAQRLRDAKVRVLATLLDNSPGWIVADLAAARAGIVHVPLPAFFTPEQVRHALVVAGVDALLTAAAHAGLPPAGRREPLTLARQALSLRRLPGGEVRIPPGTRKITFTSGTTGTPKGVCLDARAMHEVAQGLVRALAPLQLRRHLSALPYPVLLENVAGVLAPLAAGGACVALPLAQVGLAGSSAFDPALLQQAVESQGADSVIVLPQMLAAWTGWLCRGGRRAPDGLRFVAVGGAAVGDTLLRAARDRGIPAYEGYGLSEGASVQTLNLPGADRAGSAGTPLPHARVRIAADGEVEVAGSLFLGYIGEPAPVPAWWPTGDLGCLDAEGFLHVQGRKKNVLITSFGRNVSPEWVEGVLHEQAGIAQAVVYGEAQPALSAVLWVAPEVTDDVLRRCVDEANARLPDYARVTRFVRASLPFSAASGMATANGRPRRRAILDAHPITRTEAP